MQAAATAFPGRPPAACDLEPIEQWLRWEEQANLQGFRTSTQAVDVPVSAIPLERVSVRFATAPPRSLVQLFFRNGKVLFPKHPLNRDPDVAFAAEPAALHWQARFTSSRTLVLWHGAGDAAFSVKLATDHPHPDFRQPEKTELREEATDAITYAALVRRVDAVLGPDPRLVLIQEAMSVLVPGSESGFVVRDLRPLHDSHYYLPALSLPWCGPEIAERHGLRFEELWGRAYAEAVGRAKASLFARYGLQYETPNPQNILLQLDRELLPTGVIVLRDLGDANPATDALACRERPWERLLHEIRPETRNSFWAFDSADERRIAPAVLEPWYERHDRAYLAELAAFFGLAQAPDSFAAWSGFLRSRAGERAVAAAFDGRARGRPAALRSPAYA
jgi:hypothetical protein